MTGEADFGGRPLPEGVELVYRWSFLLDDLPDSMGGGYFAGEFLLRSDGILLTRAVIDTGSGDNLTWHVGSWSVFHRFPPGTGQGEAAAWLRAKDYDLGGPKPVSIDEENW